MMTIGRVFLALFAVCGAAQSAKNLGKHDSHFLQLVVPDGDAPEVLKDLAALKLAAKGMHERVGLLLQTAHTKVSVAMEKAAAAKKKADALSEKKAKREAKEAEARAAEEAAAAESGGTLRAPITKTFTTGDDVGKPLSANARARKCNIAKFKTHKEMAAALESGAHALTDPFLLQLSPKDAVLLDEVAARYWSMPSLRTIPNVTVEFLSAHAAKLKRMSQTGQTTEVFTPEQLTLKEYTKRCFGADKRSGYDTEHCDQMVPLTFLEDHLRYTPEHRDAINFKSIAGGKLFQATRRYEGAKRQIIADAVEAMSEDGAPPMMNNQDEWGRSQAQDADSRYLNFGPSGSGEQLQLTRRSRPNMDVLLRGSRRHLFMAGAVYKKLHEKAADDFNPTAAFSFFEVQYDELVEEFDLGRDELPFWECDQAVGEVLYLPPATVRVSLALEDSLSFGMDVADDPEVLGLTVENAIWQPMQQSFNLAVCLEAQHLTALPGWPNEETKKKGIAALTKQLDAQFTDLKTQNMVITSILVDCASLKEMGLPPPADKLPRLCDFAWDNCGGKLAKNLKALGFKEWPEWLPKQPKMKLTDGEEGVAYKIADANAEDLSLDESQFKTTTQDDPTKKAKKGAKKAKKTKKKKKKKTTKKKEEL